VTFKRQLIELILVNLFLSHFYWQWRKLVKIKSNPPFSIGDEKRAFPLS